MFPLLVLAQLGCAAGHRAASLASPDGWEQAQPLKAAQPTPAPVPSAELETPAASVAAAAESSSPPSEPELPHSRCPPDMALVLDAVCVDKWEASLLEVKADGSEVPWSPYVAPKGKRVTVRAVSTAGVVPQGYISGEQALAACAASGKRLCAAEEWEAACRGAADRQYPYGESRRKHVCNDGGRRRHPVIELHQQLGTSTESMWREGMSHPLINQQQDTLRKTGELAECTSDAGTFDMVGNLHEWIADPDGTFRGGFYMDTLINGEGCDYATTAHPMSYADYSTGFRCCKDADDPLD